MPRHRHHVYVVLLSDRIWNEPRFRKANPDHQLTKPCVYVGMTGLDPDLRFDRHKAGIKANHFVQRYGELEASRDSGASALDNTTISAEDISYDTT